MITIINSSYKTLANLTNLIAAKVKEQINGEYVLNFTAEVEILKTEYLYDTSNLIQYNNDYFNIVKITEIHNSGDTVFIEVHCEHISYDLISNELETFQYENKSALYLMNQALANTGFTLLGTDITTGSYSIDLENTNSRNAIVNIASLTGGELNFLKKTIQLKQQLGQNRGTDFRFGKNLKSVKRIIDRTNNAISYQVEVVQGSELEELGYYELGDTIAVIDDRLGINTSVRIVELEKDLITGINSSVTLGQPIKDLSNEFGSVINRVNKVSTDVDEVSTTLDGLVDDNGNIVASKLSGSLNEAIDNIVTATGFVNFVSGGLMICNQPTEAQSTEAMMLTPNGWLISNTKNADGTFNWRSAATGNGLNADEVNTGTLTAINIQGSTISGGNITGAKVTSQSSGKIVQIADGNMCYGASATNPAVSQYCVWNESNNSGAFAIIAHRPSNIRLSALDDNFEAIVRRTVSGTPKKVASFNIQDNGDNAMAYILFASDYTDAEENFFSVVNGSKLATVNTRTYGDIGFSAYETNKIWFGKIGSGTVVDGECRIDLDGQFIEATNTYLEYHVFLSPNGNGSVYCDTKANDHFIVKGDDISFSYEVKALRRGFESFDYNYIFLDGIPKTEQQSTMLKAKARTTSTTITTAEKLVDIANKKALQRQINEELAEMEE